jgi:hypothetical protein
LLFAGCGREHLARGPLPHEVYVWQRNWTAEVSHGVNRAAPEVARFDVLVGEVGMQGGTVRAIAAQIDFAVLAKARKPVSLGLRIGTYPGPFTVDSEPLRAGITLLRQSILQAKAAGLRVSELQIDFDCSSRRLDGYTIWVREMRAAFPQESIAITALPDWLKRREFPALAKAAGHFVLQVHSVPGSPKARPVLCDPAAARKAVALAGRVGVPFRVALPTYSCELQIDESGKVIGVRAEDTPATESPRHVLLRADAAELAALVRDWEYSRPAMLSGIIWYRLPIDSDRLNWRWPTLAAIIAGRTPEAEGKLIFEPGGSGVEDAILENLGDADWVLPAELTLPDGLLAADGVNGFRVQSDANGSTHLRNNTARILPPGERLVCGWIRRQPTSTTPAGKP